MNHVSRPRFTLEMGRSTLELGERTLVMGILNTTPDSFSDGGRFVDPDAAVDRARRLIDSGADILDIGGESTRPFSDPVPLEEELRRVVPIVEAVRTMSDIPISVDTSKAEVARRALKAGADIINDVSALRFDREMAAVVADSGAPVVLMHMQGSPRDMQQTPSYASLLSEIIAFLEERIRYAGAHGIRREQIIVDPGIGFGKTVEHNLIIIRRLELFHCLQRPILLGASRKKFIGSVLELPVERREIGTSVVHALGIAAGAHIIRVHDVETNRQTADMADAVLRSSCSAGSA